jgi:hypothetical protein
MERAYCAVGIESLYTFEVYISLQMAKILSNNLIQKWR